MLLDVFGADPKFGDASARALREARTQGALIASEIVWAEVSAAFPSHSSASEAMSTLGVAFSRGTEMSAIAAGQRWREYRQKGGGRDRIIPDFLIACHAMLGEADRLLTRDRGFYRGRFKGLVVVDPTDA